MRPVTIKQEKLILCGRSTTCGSFKDYTHKSRVVAITRVKASRVENRRSGFSLQVGMLLGFRGVASIRFGLALWFIAWWWHKFTRP